MRTQQQLKAAKRGRQTIQRNREKRYYQVWRAYKPPTTDPKFMVGLGLYIGEGAKQNEVRFSSASPNLICFMLKWFKRYFTFGAIHLYVYHHAHYKDESVQRYWARKTKLPSSVIRVLQPRQSYMGKNRNGHLLPHGTVQLRVLKPYTTRIQIDKAIHVCKLNPNP